MEGGGGGEGRGGCESGVEENIRYFKRARISGGVLGGDSGGRIMVVPTVLVGVAAQSVPRTRKASSAGNAGCRELCGNQDGRLPVLATPGAESCAITRTVNLTVGSKTPPQRPAWGSVGLSNNIGRGPA